MVRLESLTYSPSSYVFKTRVDGRRLDRYD